MSKAELKKKEKKKEKLKVKLFCRIGIISKIIKSKHVKYRFVDF